MSREQDLQKIDAQITDLSDMYEKHDVANLEDIEILEELKNLENNIYIAIKQFRLKRKDNYFNGTSTQRKWFEIEKIGVGVSNKLKQLERISKREKDNQKKPNWFMEHLVVTGLLILAMLVTAAITIFVFEPWQQKLQENEVISKTETETGIPVTDADGSVHYIKTEEIE